MFDESKDDWASIIRAALVPMVCMVSACFIVTVVFVVPLAVVRHQDQIMHECVQQARRGFYKGHSINKYDSESIKTFIQQFNQGEK